MTRGKIGTAVNSEDYILFLQDIKNKIAKARAKAYRNLNSEVIKLYLDIGKSIVEKLSEDLRKDFPGVRGYSARNLWDMRRFYIEYKDSENLRQLVAEIPWGQNLVILARI